MATINQTELRERTRRFIADTGLPVSKFVKRVDISRTGYYKWQSKVFDFGQQRSEIIDRFLRQFNY